jgi:hypothetical protein
MVCQKEGSAEEDSGNPGGTRNDEVEGEREGGQ